MVEKRLKDKPYPWIMGILNVTPDSFSDGGQFLKTTEALKRAETLVAGGADILDIGGESSRPGARLISEAEERKRVMPIIRAIRKRFDIPLSIDTVKASVACAALEAGADWINDISALRHDPAMAATVADAGAPLVLMHRAGTANAKYLDVEYENVIEDIKQFFRDRIHHAMDAGIAEENIMLDPGIGFGKRALENCLILEGLSEFKTLGHPLLIGTSRKSFIGEISQVPVEQRLPGTVASTLMAVLNGADIVRVHDVAEVHQALLVMHHIAHASEHAHA